MSENSVAAALRATTRELEAGGIENAANDARRLVAYALDFPQAQLTPNLGDRVTSPGLAALDKAITARLERRPVSQILGRRAFWGRDFKVTPAVLDPRPETEILIEHALSQPFERVLDLGTGSGCILLSLLAERPDAVGVGVDASPDALSVASENSAALGLDARAALVVSDWFSHVSGRFDLIVANPPYIALSEMSSLAPEVLKWEPMAALCAGPEGVEMYREIARDIGSYVTDTGRVLVEIGPTQAQAVSGLFEVQGFEIIAIHDDFDGRNRVVEMKLRLNC